jgi:hypothetical protein
MKKAGRAYSVPDSATPITTPSAAPIAGRSAAPLPDPVPDPVLLACSGQIRKIALYTHVP